LCIAQIALGLYFPARDYADIVAKIKGAAPLAMTMRQKELSFLFDGICRRCVQSRARLIE
jgi:hypothetical protein